MKTFMTLVMLLACGIHAVLSVDGNESSANLSGNSNWIYQIGPVLLAVAVLLIGRSLYRFTHLPTVIIRERKYTAVIGEQVKLECTISATTWITTVSWQRISPERQPVALDIDQIKYIGSKPNDPHLVIDNIKKDDEGEYVCTVSNVFMERQSAPTKLKVKGGPPTLNMKPKRLYKTEGDVAILKCNVIAEPPASNITWTKEEEGCERKIAIDNNKYFDGSLACPSLVIAETESHDEGKYICRVENIAGSGSNSVHLTINSKTVKSLYKANSEELMKERIAHEHAKMVTELSEYVSPKLDTWSKFRESIRWALPPAYLEEDLNSIVESLMKKHHIDYGQYQTLYEAVDKFDRNPSIIIKKAEAHIKAIRDGDVVSPMEMDVSKAKKEFGFDLDTRPGIRDEVSSRKKGVSTVEKELGIGTRSEIRDSANEPKPKPDVESNPELKDAFSTELKFVPDSEHENAPQPKPVDVPKTERLVVSETGFKGKDGPELETEVKFNQEPQDELADEPKFVSNLEPEDLPIPEPVEDPKTETLDEPEVALTEKGDTYRRLAQKYNLTDDCVVPVKDASNQEELIIIYDPSCNKERKLKEFGHDIMIRNPKYVSTEGAIVSSICKTEQYSIKPEDRNNLKQALRHHSKRLFASHSNLNIITTSPVKSKNKGADIIECLCIVVVCSSKGYIPKGESKFPEELIFENTSFVIDVREGYFQFGPTSYSTFNSSLFHQHIKMGCSFGIEGTHNAGTVGPFVDFQGHQLFLTCAHIVTGVDPNGYDLNNIQNMFAEQPDAITFSDPQNRGYITRRCGEVRRAVFLPNNSPSVDAAVVEITEQSRMPSRGEFAIDDKNNIETAGFDDLPRFESGDIHDNPDTLHTDLRTVKFGAKTHATRGVISSVGTSARPLTTDLGLQGQPNTCVMKNQIEVFSLRGHSNFFLPGDSGSGVFEVNTLPTGEQKLTCIGLAIGCTSYGSAVVTPIAAVLDALELPRNLKQFP